MTDGGVTGLTTEQIQALVDALKNQGVDIDFDPNTGTISGGDVDADGNKPGSQNLILEEVPSQEQ